MNLSALVHRIFGKNIAGMLGVIGVLIPLFRELVVVALRIAAVFLPGLEKYVDLVTGIANKVEKVWDNIKRFFLDMAPNSLSGGGSPSG